MVDLEPFVELCRDVYSDAENAPDEPLNTYRQRAVAEIRDRADDDMAVIEAVAERLLEVAGPPNVTAGNGSGPRHSSRTGEADFLYVVASLLLGRPVR